MYIFLWIERYIFVIQQLLLSRVQVLGRSNNRYGRRNGAKMASSVGERDRPKSATGVEGGLRVFARTATSYRIRGAFYITHKYQFVPRIMGYIGGRV